MKNKYSYEKLLSTVSVFLLLLCTACSAIYRYRGLSPQINKTQKKEGLKLSYHYQWKMSKFGAAAVEIFSKKHRISFLAYTNAGNEQILTLGPALLFLPLPLIPWPPGIYKALTKRSADAVIPKDLMVWINISGTPKNSNFEIDFSKVDIIIDPPMENKSFWEVKNWNSDRITYTFEAVSGPQKIVPWDRSFRLTLPGISNAIRSISIKFHDVKVSDTQIDLPAFVFEKGIGYGLYFGVIND